MKRQKFFAQASRLRNVIVVTALAASFAVPTLASAAVSVKAGDSCSKSQVNKTSGTFKCTYNSKTKKYSWSASKKTESKANWPKSLVIAAVPSENAASMTLRYQNFVKLIEKETGLPTSFFAATDYAGAIEAQVAGRVDLVFYGPFSYVLAKARGAKIEPIGAAISSPTAKPGYYSYGLAKASNSAVSSIKDFKGKKVCFVDAASTSGYLYPIAGLLANSVTDRDYTSVLAGGHDKAALAVAAGTCDVGFAYDDMVDVNLIEKGLLKKGELKVVWKSETIAGSPMAVRIDLPKDLVQILKSAVLDKANKPYFVKVGYCTDEATCRIIEDGSWGFTKVNDAYYDGIRQVCEATKSSRCR